MKFLLVAMMCLFVSKAHSFDVVKNVKSTIRKAMVDHTSKDQKRVISGIRKSLERVVINSEKAMKGTSDANTTSLLKNDVNFLWSSYQKALKESLVAKGAVKTLRWFAPEKIQRVELAHKSVNSQKVDYALVNDVSLEIKADFEDIVGIKEEK